MSNELIAIVQAQRSQFDSVRTDPSIEFEREAAFALQLLTGNDFLAGTAMKNRASLQSAVINVAAIGISLNPASKLAYLVPRDGRVCLDISYMGMMHIAQQCGAIQWGQAKIVCDKDEFQLREINETPIHKYNPFSTERGEVIGAYVVVKTDTGDFLTHAMPISAIHKIRDRSPSWKKNKSGPWATDPGEMVKKTVVKQASKYWPRRERLDNAVHHMNTDGGEGIDMGSADDVTLMVEWVAKANASESSSALQAVWKEGVAMMQAAKDKAGYAAFKAAVGERGAQLQTQESQQ